MNSMVVKQTCFVAVLVITLFSCKKTEVVQVPVEQGTKNDTTAPVITGFTPGVSWYGNIVTINGTGFSKLASKVWIGTTPAEILTATETSIKIKIAPATQGGYIHVKVNGREGISSKELIIDQLAWTKEIGGSDGEIAICIIPIPGGYMVTGYTNSKDGDIKPGHGGLDMWVAQLDSNRNIKWQQSIGGSGNDLAGYIVPSSDGGYVLTGYSTSKDGDLAGGPGGTADIWAIKLSIDGAIVWKKPLGGTGDDEATAIANTADGGYLITGYTASNDKDVTGLHGGEDMWVVKLNGNGQIVWQKTLGGSKQDGGSAIKPTADGGCIVAGYTSSTDGDVQGKHGGEDLWVVRLNANGGIVWQKPLGGASYEYALSLAITADGGCVVAGSTGSSDGDVTGLKGASDIWIIKLTSAGGISWQQTLGGSGNEDPIAIIPTTDGGYMIAANTDSNDGDIGNNHGSSDIWIAKLNANRTITGKRTLGGSGGEIAFSMATTPDNGYVVAGYSNSTNGDLHDSHGYYDMWLFKIWQ